MPGCDRCVPEIRTARPEVATKLGFADEAWARAEPQLSAYVAEAAALRGSTCETASEAARACLDHREAALAAVIDVLGDSDRDSLARASAVTSGLPRLGA